MSQTQKFAWFNLVVVLLSLGVVVCLLPMMGAQRAHSGLGFLRLLGLGPIFLRRKKG